MRYVKEYSFFNSNVYVGNYEKYDISGEQYKKMIKRCCTYCKFFSLDMTYGKPLFYDELNDFKMDDLSFVYRISDVAHVNLKGAVGIGFEDTAQMMEAARNGWLRFYNVTEKSCELLMNAANSIFSWKFGREGANAESLSFYRADGSMLFCSNSQVCFLDLYENEDFDDIISKSPWLSVDGWRLTYLDENLRLDRPMKIEGK